MDTVNKERRKAYLERKEEGLCPRCGRKKRKSEKFIYCDACREYHRNAHQKVASRQNKKKRTEYEERKNNRQCPRCGKILGKKYKNTTCRECLDKQYDYCNPNIKKVYKKKKIQYYQRKENGQCTRCGKVLGKKDKHVICRKCIDKRNEYNERKKMK